MDNLFVSVPGIWRPLATLILASVVIMGSPGPSTISVTAIGASFGVRRSLRYTGGLIVGTIAVLVAVSAGAVAMMAAVPFGERVLSVISAVYICFLAFKIATAPPLERREHRTAAPAFAGGFLLAIANPKAWLAIGAVFAGTSVIVDDHRVDAVVKLTVLSVMIVIIHICWLLAGASLSRVLHDPVSSCVINVSLAVSLVIVTLLSLVN